MKKVLLIISLLLFVTGCETSSQNFTNNNANTNEKNNSNSSSNENNKSYSDNSNLSESDIMMSKIISLIKLGKAYDTGTYSKGEVTKGEYAFIKFDGSGSYYEELDRAGDIIDNENFSSFGYVKVHGVGEIETRGVLIDINSFSELGVTSAKEIYEKLNNIKEYYESGYYKVGVDIKPGTYTIESIGKGYFAILSGPVGNSDIIKNDNFSGKKQVTLRNGQYLELSRVQIIN